MYACAGGHEKVVKLLLKNIKKVEDHNENGLTPLIWALKGGGSHYCCPTSDRSSDELNSVLSTRQSVLLFEFELKRKRCDASSASA